MDYNTTRKKLFLPEYGRNVQKMVDYMLTIEDRKERTAAAYSIVDVMNSISPHPKEGGDFRQKLWGHLAIMANFQLDVDAPYELPKKEEYIIKPEKLPYRTSKIKYKHFGRTIEALIGEAVKMEEGEEKEALTLLIANHMKKTLSKWNKEGVTDQMVFNDLKEISGGKIIVPDSMKLSEFKSAPQKTVKRRRHSNSSGSRRKRY